MIPVITLILPILIGTTTSFSQDVSISDKLTFSGGIELDYSYTDDRDTGDNTGNESAYDLDIGTVELGLEVAFHEYVTGNFLLKGEALKLVRATLPSTIEICQSIALSKA